MRRMRFALQRYDWHVVPRLAPAFAEVVYGDGFNVRSQERHERPANLPSYRRGVQNRVVSLPPNPQGNGRTKRRASGRSGSGGGDRRNLARRKQAPSPQDRETETRCQGKGSRHGRTRRTGSVAAGRECQGRNLATRNRREPESRCQQDRNGWRGGLYLRPAEREACSNRSTSRN